jgi:hypothetical protein
MADVDYHDVFNWHPGDPPESDGPVRSAGLAVVRALHDLHDHAAKMAADGYLTAEGAAEILAPLQEKVVAEAARQRRVVAAAAVELNAAEDRLFAPPPLEPGDAAGASDDTARRAWYESLDANQRAEFEAEVAEGKHPELVRALARSPVPGRARAFGIAAWHAQVEREKPGPVHYLERRRRGVAWAEGVLRVAPRAAQSNPWSQTPIESPIERMTRARSSMKPATTA